MSGVTLSFNITENGPQMLFTELVGKLSPDQLKVMLDEMGQSLRSDVVDRFDRQVSPDGTPWEPSQRALIEGGKTLINSGDLLASIAPDVPSDHSFVVGTNLAYGAIHNFGGTTGRNGATEIIAREWIGLASPQEAILQDVYQGWFQ